MRRVLPLILLALTSCAQRDGTKAPEIRWYRGNLHTHTLWSDGDDFPDMVVDWYREAGYDFLALSDHNVLSEGERWVDVDQKLRPAFDKYVDHLGPNAVDTVAVAGTTRVRLKTLAELRAAFEEPDRFILIQSEEITESVDKLPVHLNATNVKEFIPPQGGSTVVEVMQRNIDAVLAQRERTHQAMFPHINHPNFGWGITVEDILAVEGEKFFEIYNGHPLVHNLGDADHSSVEDMWDVILATRLSTGGEPMYGLAVDDAHHYHGMDRSLANPGRGWVMVGADTLTPEGIVDAMEAGRFYASTGVVLRDVRRLPDRLEIEIQAGGRRELQDGVRRILRRHDQRHAVGRRRALFCGRDASVVRLERRRAVRSSARHFIQAQDESESRQRGRDGMDPAGGPFRHPQVILKRGRASIL